MGHGLRVQLYHKAGSVGFIIGSIITGNQPGWERYLRSVLGVGGEHGSEAQAGTSWTLGIYDSRCAG